MTMTTRWDERTWCLYCRMAVTSLASIRHAARVEKEMLFFVRLASSPFPHQNHHLSNQNFWDSLASTWKMPKLIACKFSYIFRINRHVILLFASTEQLEIFYGCPSTWSEWDGEKKKSTWPNQTLTTHAHRRRLYYNIVEKDRSGFG